MSDGSLSQDEIDALLQGSAGMDFDEPAEAPSTSGGVDANAFLQIVSGTLGSQKSNLSMLMSSNVDIRAQEADLSDESGLAGGLEGQVVRISLGLRDGVNGSHGYLLSESAGKQIAGAMMGQDNIDLDEAAINALQEAFSQVSGPVLTALGERVGATVMSEPPAGGLVSGPESGFPPGQYVRVRYNVTIEGQAPVSYVEVFDSQAVSAVLGAGGMSGGGMGGGMSQPAAAQNQGQMFGQPNMMQQQPMMGQPGMQQGGQPPANQANVQSVQFPGLSPGGPPTEQGNIGLLMDVYMEMTVELGRTRRLIKEILGMGEGTIIELDKLAGEPVDILVNHKLIAKGEVVVIDENFGVRVTEIVSPLERVSDVG